MNMEKIMSAFGKMSARIIRIYTAEHRDTGLLMAVSRELPGLLVHGRSEEELEQKLPHAIQEILEAQGNTVVSISVAEEEQPSIPESFKIPPAFIASANLQSSR